MKRQVLTSVLTLLIVSALLTGACGAQKVQVVPTPTPNVTTVAEFQSAVQPILQRWDDAFSIANSSPRMSLGPAISNLQTVRSDMNNVQVTGNPHLISAKDHYVSGMQAAIDGFLSFLAQDSDSTVNSHFKSSSNHFDQAENSLKSAIAAEASD